MFRLVLASHGRLAEGMKNTVQIILGEFVELNTICAYVDENSNLEDQIEQLWNRFDESDEIVIVTDLFGGSVNNEFMNLLNRKKFWLIAGMNLSMIIELAFLSGTDNIEEKLEHIVQKSRESIRFCNGLLSGNDSESEEF